MRKSIELQVRAPNILMPDYWLVAQPIYMDYLGTVEKDVLYFALKKGKLA